MRGVCAFDIDNTLTCGNTCTVEKRETILRAIELCKEHDMKVVINTARPPQNNVLFGIHPDIVTSLQDVDIFTMNTMNTSRSVPQHKLDVQYHLSRAHAVDPLNVVLIDDRADTVELLNGKGTNAVLVRKSNGSYGIDEQALLHLKDTLSGMTPIVDPTTRPS